MIKQSIRFLADKSADAALDGKEFSPRMKRLVILVIKISIGVLILDFLIAGLRYGNLGLKDWYYYATMLVLLGICYNVVRDDAETSLKEMRHSKNGFVKGIFFAMFAFVTLMELSFKILAPVLLGICNMLENYTAPEEEPYNANWNNMGSPGYDRTAHMNDYMMDARNDPPS